MLEFLTLHSTIIALVVYWTVSAAISAMPAPDASSSKGYVWFYGFSHTLAGNLKTALPFLNRTGTFDGNEKGTNGKPK